MGSGISGGGGGSGGATVGEVVAAIGTPWIAARPYIDAADYFPADDTIDGNNELQAALTAAAGSKLYFSNPAGQKRTYRLTDRSRGRVTAIGSVDIEFADGAELVTEWDVSNAATNHPLFSCEAVVEPEYPSDYVTSTVFTLADQAAINEFQNYRGLVYISSDDLFTKEQPTYGTRGEWAFIESTLMYGDGRLRCFLQSALKDEYETNRKVRKPSASKLRILQPQMIGAGNFENATTEGDIGIVATGYDSAFVDGGSVREFDKHGLLLVACRKWRVNDTEFMCDPKDALAKIKYPFAYANGCQKGIADGITVIGGREGVAQTHRGGLQGPTRGVRLINGTSRLCERSGVAEHNTTEGTQIDGWTFENCEQFIDLRTKGGSITNCRGYNSGTGLGNLDCAVQFGSGCADVFIDGNKWHNVLRGYFGPRTLANGKQHEDTPGDYFITNDVITGDRCERGVLLQFKGSTEADYVQSGDALGNLTISNFVWKFKTEEGLGVSKAIAVETWGAWQRPWIGGHADGGNGGPIVQLWQGEDDVTGPNAPAIHVRHSSNFLSPFVWGATGKELVGNVGTDFSFYGEFSSGWLASHNFGELAGFGSFEFVTIPAEGVRIGDLCHAWLDVPHAGVIVEAQCSVNGEILVHVYNMTSVPKDLATGRVYWRFVHS